MKQALRKPLLIILGACVVVANGIVGTTGR